jgi:hypothetical protein
MIRIRGGETEPEEASRTREEVEGHSLAECSFPSPEEAGIGSREDLKAEILRDSLDIVKGDDRRREDRRHRPVLTVLSGGRRGTE